MDEEEKKAAALQTLAMDVATQFLTLVSDLIAGRKNVIIRRANSYDLRNSLGDTHIVIE